ncbi:geranylgeranyl reductase family protein [Corynebacterium sp. sy039]|nr:geranylgeranyl reductase family protein [Corynebacterium sp. sy039]
MSSVSKQNQSTTTENTRNATATEKQTTQSHITTDVLIVGAGPAGSAAAIHSAQRGFHTVLVDMANFPRDKTCGDGLTPRAISELAQLGLARTITDAYTSQGLKLHGFGGSVTAPWHDSTYGTIGSAMPRVQFDQLLFDRACSMPEVQPLTGSAAVKVELEGHIRSVELADGTRIFPRFVIVADGVRSTFGKLLGRTWHRGEVYGIAARSYCTTPYADEPWIHSHLELRAPDNSVQPGYGWIFPLGAHNGTANVGCGALSTAKRPAKINTKKLLAHYVSQTSDQWHFGTPQQVTSALLPMGGAVSNVAGANWLLIGDAAACVNPLNGEGIDYGLETARLGVELLGEHKDLTFIWGQTLRDHYGEAFLLARTAARLLTYPQFLPVVGPLALGKPFGSLLMPAAARLMGNLVSEHDKDIVARAWRLSAKTIGKLRGNTPLWS